MRHGPPTPIPTHKPHPDLTLDSPRRTFWQVSRFEYLLIRPDILFESDEFDFVEVADLDYIGVL